MGRAPILHVDAERGFSGGEVQVFLLLEGLRERGWSQALVAPPESAAAQRARERGFLVHPVAMASDLCFRAVGKIQRAARSFGAGLLHLHTGRATWLGSLAAARSGLTAVTTRRMDRVVKRNWRTRAIHNRWTAATVAISPNVAAALLAGGVQPERVETIWSAVDPARLAPRRGRERTRAELGVPGDTPLVLAMGSLVPRKGFHLLLEALRAAPLGAYRAVLVGEGPERRRLMDLGAGLPVDLLGRREDVGDLLAAADLVVMPSLAEGLGVAALEAMGAGVALIASRVGGLAHAVVHGESGWLVPPGDPAALAQGISMLLSDPHTRARLGRGGRARVAQQFLPDRMVAAYEALYERLLP